MSAFESTSRPSATEVRVGTASQPFLADHGFHGMVVLPGAFYVDCALRLLGAPGVVRNVEFHQPLILAGEDATLRVEAKAAGENIVAFQFREAHGRDAGDAPLVTLQIESSLADPTLARAPSAADAPSRLLGAQIDRDEFYSRLRANGNAYGPAFQQIERVRRSNHEAWAQISDAAPRIDAQGFLLHPVLLDAAVQVLSIFGVEQGRTFVLRGIERVTVSDLGSFRPGAVCVRRDFSAGDDELRGDIFLYDEKQRCRVALIGVSAALTDAAEQSATAAPEIPVTIAATFTAEPVEDTFRFWSDTLKLPMRVSFAPYNQIFQQLLDPGSAFRKNTRGVNVVLLNLADWAEARHAQALATGMRSKRPEGEDLRRFTLPNGLEIAHLNRHETEYVFREIFVDRCYLRHGIALPERATVIDIGANIGLFSLFVRSEAPDAKVFSYEPSPVAFRALAANCAAYGPGLQPFNVGVSERRGAASLTFYETSSVFSSFHPDRDSDRHAIQAVVTNMVRDELRGDSSSVDGLVDELMTDRLAARSFDCPLISVSDIIRDNDLQRIDLLKIDAEKCELEILRGIDATLWPRIEQVVVEVHDRTREVLDEVQRILVREGFHCAVVEENLLTGSGLFNVYATRPERPARAARTAAAHTGLVAAKWTADELVAALKQFSAASATSTVVCLCPCETAALSAVEQAMARALEGVPRLRAIGSGEIIARYPGPAIFQGDAQSLGHIPYTPAGFAAIGTAVFRAIAAERRAPLKVIALDCDGTLWRGACGEEGATGVTVTPQHRALQEKLLQQRDAGVLLCLCSKNHESDVWPVFAQNSGMMLKREHFSAHRINWAPKSENLRELARELNVGADSVLLIDDNPLEIAEVKAHAPEAATAQLPADVARIPHFLEHLWLLDRAGVTEEDRQRADRIAEAKQREAYRAETTTLAEFIAGLNLQVEISSPAPADLPRIAQLTQRTNQFNFTTVRRTEGELAEYLQDPRHHCLAVEVSDRFGDYGLVGVVLYERAGDAMRVDTFLLSCRVLGRGVEHQALAELGRRAVAETEQAIELAVTPTDKNQPAQDFLRSLASEWALEASGLRMSVPPEKAAALRYVPAAASTEMPEAPVEKRLRTAPGPDRFQEIAERWDNAPKIADAVEAFRLRAAGFDESAAPGVPDTLAGRILKIWRVALGNLRIGLDDRFMEVGGTSLKAVQVVAALRRELNLPVSVVAFFERPTVRLLAEKFSPQTEKKQAAAASDAMARGAKRMQQLRRRTETPAKS